MERLADRIREARQDAGLTVEQLARVAQVGVRQLHRWEAGQNEPRLDSLVRIAEATGKDIAFFVLQQTSSAA
jgi:transcriptional regulator with XRE-family HTH domain